MQGVELATGKVWWLLSQAVGDSRSATMTTSDTFQTRLSHHHLNAPSSNMNRLSIELFPNLFDKGHHYFGRRSNSTTAKKLRPF